MKFTVSVDFQWIENHGTRMHLKEFRSLQTSTVYSEIKNICCLYEDASGLRNGVLDPLRHTYYKRRFDC